MSFFKTLFKQKKQGNPLIKIKYSNTIDALRDYIKKRGHFPRNIVKAFTDNTGQHIKVANPTIKTTLFDVNPKSHYTK